MWQQTIIIGNVGSDPGFAYTPHGIAVCNFSVAVNKVTGSGEDRKEKTTWFRVTVWREKAETASKYIKRGMKIMVLGDISARAYIDKEGQAKSSLELTGYSFQFLERAKQDGNVPVIRDGQSVNDGDNPNIPQTEPPGKEENEIPF